ncbi:MAG: hypothetical protein AAGH48_02455 [Pseudomonadota bacterium]
MTTPRIFGAHFAHLLEGGGAATTRILEAGAFSIAPKGVWHTVDVLEKGRALFITAGAGTQHRPR